MLKAKSTITRYASILSKLKRMWDITDYFVAVEYTDCFSVVV